MSDLPISFEDVVAAARRIEGVAHRTPVLTSSTADALTRAKLFFKAETLQRMGAFKFRGGYNSLAQFTPEQKAGGVIAYSSGNHAQAIALSAKLLDMRAVIIMPEDAPAIKIAATRGYGAEVVLYDRYSEDREEIGNRLAAEQGLTLIPPYDHPHVMAGQGTAVLEMFEQVGAPDLLLVPVGRGIWRPIAASSASSPKPAMTPSAAWPRAASSISIPRAPSPTARRPSIWANTPSRCCASWSTRSSPSATPS
jgi:threonine dehydratase